MVHLLLADVVSMFYLVRVSSRVAPAHWQEEESGGDELASRIEGMVREMAEGHNKHFDLEEQVCALPPIPCLCA